MIGGGSLGSAVSPQEGTTLNRRGHSVSVSTNRSTVSFSHSPARSAYDVVVAVTMKPWNLASWEHVSGGIFPES